MAKGGKRLGAGRPKGAISKSTRAIQEAANAAGVMPLDVMLQAMRADYAAGKLDEAAAHAEKAAPYLHPKLAAIEHSGPDGGPIQHAFEVVIVDPKNPG